MKKLIQLFNSLFIPKYVLLGAFLLFSLLLFRNPFSLRTLIGNMEPYPDVLHYVTPARSLATGGPFKLTREYGELNPVVAPLYSIYLVPFYLINSDARMYYFANVLLSLLSVFLFYKVILKLTKSIWIIGFSLFLFVTNYYLYWYPTWAMAENMVIPLFLLGAYLFLEKVNFHSILAASFVGIAFYATKYAYIPLTFFFSLSYFLKILIQKKDRPKNLLTLIIFSILFLIPTLLYGYFIQGINPFGDLFGQIISLADKPTIITPSENPWFSKMYFGNNFDFYLSAIQGYVRRFLWEFKPLYPRWIFFAGSLGLILSLFTKKFRVFSVFLLILLFSQVIFMSTFYSADARYIFHAIPVLYLGVSLIFILLLQFLKEKKAARVFYVLYSGVFLFYISQSFLSIKNQIVLNLKYAETPWTYISVQKINGYFSEKESKRPIVITPLPPYYVDYFSNGNYELLPLSPQQDFRQQRELVWGPGDYSDFISLYKTHLTNGRVVFLATYGIGNEAYMHEAVNDIFNNFVEEEVVNDCFNLCRIYKLSLNHEQ